MEAPYMPEYSLELQQFVEEVYVENLEDCYQKLRLEKLIDLLEHGAYLLESYRELLGRGQVEAGITAYVVGAFYLYLIIPQSIEFHTRNLSYSIYVDLKRHYESDPNMMNVMLLVAAKVGSVMQLYLSGEGDEKYGARFTGRKRAYSMQSCDSSKLADTLGKLSIERSSTRGTTVFEGKTEQGAFGQQQQDDEWEDTVWSAPNLEPDDQLKLAVSYSHSPSIHDTSDSKTKDSGLENNSAAEFSVLDEEWVSERRSGFMSQSLQVDSSDNKNNDELPSIGDHNDVLDRFYTHGQDLRYPICNDGVVPCENSSIMWLYESSSIKCLDLLSKLTSSERSSMLLIDLRLPKRYEYSHILAENVINIDPELLWDDEKGAPVSSVKELELVIDNHLFRSRRQFATIVCYTDNYTYMQIDFDFVFLLFRLLYLGRPQLVLKTLSGGYEQWKSFLKELKRTESIILSDFLWKRPHKNEHSNDIVIASGEPSDSNNSKSFPPSLVENSIPAFQSDHKPIAQQSSVGIEPIHRFSSVSTYSKPVVPPPIPVTRPLLNPATNPLSQYCSQMLVNAVKPPSTNENSVSQSHLSTTPDAKSVSQSNLSTTPDAKSVSQSNLSTTPDAKSVSQSNLSTTPDAKSVSQSNLSTTPDAKSVSQSNLSTTPDAKSVSQSNLSTTPDAKSVSQSNLSTTPDAKSVSQSNLSTTPDAKSVSQSNLSTTPDAKSVSQSHLSSTPDAKSVSQSNLSATPESNLSATPDANSASQSNLSNTPDAKSVSHVSITTTTVPMVLPPIPVTRPLIPPPFENNRADSSLSSTRETNETVPLPLQTVRNSGSIPFYPVVQDNKPTLSAIFSDEKLTSQSIVNHDDDDGTSSKSVSSSHKGIMPVKTVEHDCDTSPLPNLLPKIPKIVSSVENINSGLSQFVSASSSRPVSSHNIKYSKFNMSQPPIPITKPLLTPSNTVSTFHVPLAPSSIPIRATTITASQSSHPNYMASQKRMELFESGSVRSVTTSKYPLPLVNPIHDPAQVASTQRTEIYDNIWRALDRRSERRNHRSNAYASAYRKNSSISHKGADRSPEETNNIKVDGHKLIRNPIPHFSIPTIENSYNEYVALSITGLRNMSNTCYINSMLQCLFSTSAFRNLFLSNKYAHYLKSPEMDTMSRSFYMLFRKMYMNGGCSVVPSGFLKMCNTLKPDLRIPYGQQDTQEFLLFLLDKLHDELSSIESVSNDYSHLLLHDNVRLYVDDAQYNKWFDQNIDQNGLSPIDDLFQGQMENQLSCQRCGYSSYTYSTFYVLSLALPNPVAKAFGKTKKLRLEDCINFFTCDEVLSDQNAWDCPRCCSPSDYMSYDHKGKRKISTSFESLNGGNSSRSKLFKFGYKMRSRSEAPKFSSKLSDKVSNGKPATVKSLNFITMPRILVIHLSRFIYDLTKKNNIVVSYPLILNIVLKNSEVAKFRLYSIVNHFGTLISGHYTSLVNKELNHEISHGKQKWYYFDDEIVKFDTNHGDYDNGIASVSSSNVYVLFYERIFD
ncbi:ubiquitin-specific protease UBP7 Ecym_4009 [Eremothecium cymbalariae DBVPG|uniref:ubiquitinyl hydrolase 1 n=1 Tax=Eremothecium cymbalariae (strain CBS 270.75 / DBVPG 7215 / KCTC 17166 / NRRL Y-17582) TaxID=931890 RepID=G8JSU0_ERECY|nr:hypothetical protein Ecym_4009 [Eremothecium cymbalariae DBVPG\